MAEWTETVDVSSIAANLAWRKEATARAARDLAYRRRVRRACHDSMIYYLNGWCWLHEPRKLLDENGKAKPHVLPFITRPHQDNYIRDIEEALGLKSIGVKKCRDEGFSWMMNYFALRDFTFKRDIKVGLVSSTKEKSDTPGNMDSLLAKIDWAIARQPKWFLGRKCKNSRDDGGDWYRNISESSFVHNRFNTSINGFAATGEGPRGGRYLWYGFDEFASNEWQDEGCDKKALEAVGDATPSKLYISTPEGPFGEFYRMMTQPSDMVRIEMDWRDNREKSRGLYRMIGGVPKAVHPETDPLPKHYNPPTQDVIDRFSRLRKNGFDLDRGSRSEWYDIRCDQPDATPQGIAKNVDAEWGGSVATVFDNQFFDVVKGTARDPFSRGNFNVSSDQKRDFGRSASGSFLLWCSLDAQGRPPQHRYVVCADFGHGRGGSHTSNSALHVIDLVTMEQVAEYATNIVDPLSFADVCLAVCEWFWGAYFAWEHNQPGNVATERVKERGYSNAMLKPRFGKMGGRNKTDEIGWWTDDKTKEIMFVDFLVAVKAGDLIIRSKSLVEECSQYIREGKKIIHAAEGPGHGDRVIAICIGRQAMKDRPVSKKDAADYRPWGDGPPPYGTLAYREWLDAQRSSDDEERTYGWDDRSTADLRTGRNMIGAA